ncbi:PIG-L deacetylase family protein [Deinococcus ruber]|uniref:PIG-L domain-containing protein n=1 Tax=Deinococcus ruber TaxID=1848197 RepID=A0A918EZ22_9DEIO|nr:PIG-L deacetylase family protein [Deinococcus ruber]GGQ92491.1 PIG-L domain-containing protein [Deinococcus ruber]
MPDPRHSPSSINATDTETPETPFGYRHDYPPTLLAVFAHPDDEAFSVGGTLAHYAEKGVRVVLVCATRGEAGKITDPSMTVTDLGAQREQELRNACDALGIPAPIFLDYHDSGRAERVRHDDPLALMNVDVFELETKIRAIIEEVQPQIIVTFDPHGGYGHIDHLQVHRATSAAFFSTGHLPKPPQRLYFTALTHAVAEQIGRFGNDLDPTVYGVSDKSVVVRMDVGRYTDRKKAALAAHGTQMGPESRMGQMPPEQREAMERVFLGGENFSLGGSRASVPRYPLGGLFDGVDFVMYVDD